MIDPKLLRDEFEATKARLEARGLPEGFEKIPSLDESRRKLLQEVESLRAKKNKLNPEIAKAKKEGSDVEHLFKELKESSQREKELNAEIDSVEKELRAVELVIPNLPEADVPEGADESANRLEKEWGEKPSLNFEPKNHWDVGESLGILDFETAAKISGARFAVYRGDGARLERALISYMLDCHRDSGYEEIFPPYMVRAETMQGSGQLPKFEEDLFKLSRTEIDMYLIPTSEVVLCNMHAGEILAAEDLPKYYTAYTPCFRAEAGSHGRDVRGLIRLHQFNKVELVKLTKPEDSLEELEKLTSNAEKILESLNLPYRRMTLCTGDMGLAASKTYDLEVWLPGADAYREISSCSTTNDFQGRRTKTRFRRTPKDKPEFVHMLNGSGLAVGRTLVAILENYQQEDGSVIIPEVLRPYMAGQEKIEA